MAAALGPLPLGGTPDGKAWCRKALHPADHEIASARYPGGSKVPTVSSTYTQVAELIPDPTKTGHITSWDAHLYMRQDPVSPVGIRITTRLDNGASGEIRFPWLNRTVSTANPFGGTSYRDILSRDVNAAFTRFLEGKNFYRVTHMGLTIEHVCSSTTNQGTIMSAQYSTEPVVRPLAGWPASIHVTADPGGAAMAFGAANAFAAGRYPLSSASEDGFSLYQGMMTRHYLEGTPSAEMLLQATNGYTGPAREGLYIPLKLDSPDRFVNVDKKYILLGREEDPKEYRPGFAVRNGKYGESMGWPYYAKYSRKGGLESDPELVVGCKECGSTVSDTLIQGLDPHASLRLYLRVGVEYVPEIDTATACFARMSPLPDELAVRMYQELTCRLKDAYPMDYNDKSRLLGVIDSYAKKLVPMIDKGLNFFAKLPGNPWGGVADGLRMLTSAYMAPAGGKGKKSRVRKAKGGSATSTVADQSVLQKAASAVALGTQRKRTVTLGNGQKITIERRK